ncbi:acyltransferase family protein [Thermophilibacter sp.]
MVAERDCYLQALRGICVAAVVMIHSLPELLPTVLLPTVAIRPLLNVAVALFVFLSGYLMRTRDSFPANFFGKRLGKTLVPYAVWTVLYTIAKGRPDMIVANLASGQASMQLYYLLAYAQLVILTPLVIIGLRCAPILVYAVTPVFLAINVANEALGILPFSLPPALRVYWVVFYALGMDWDRVSKALGRARLADKTPILFACALARLGDASFGVYLCHAGVLVVLETLLAALGLATGYVQTAFLWAGTLSVSYVGTVACGRVLPRPIGKALGFA